MHLRSRGSQNSIVHPHFARSNIKPLAIDRFNTIFYIINIYIFKIKTDDMRKPCITSCRDRDPMAHVPLVVCSKILRVRRNKIT